MQTFLPYASYRESAKCLDRQRLGKQRVECLQILHTLLGESKGWTNHPAVRMWKNYELSLADYSLAICNEWVFRGYKDTCRDKIHDLIDKHLHAEYMVWEGLAPPWMNIEEFHISHQSNLLRKLPSHYEQFHWNVPNDLPYIWPLNSCTTNT